MFRSAISDIRHEYRAGELMGHASPEAREKRIAEVRAIAARAAVEGTELKGNVSYAEIVADVSEGTPGSLIELSWKTCSGFAHGDWWTTKSASRRIRIPGATEEGIGTFKIEANLWLLMKMTSLAVAETGRGWRLHDQRCLPPS
jgi:hypothetical protein